MSNISPPSSPRSLDHIDEIEALGGMAKAIEAGIPKLRIEEAAAKTQARIDSGKQSVIGVNKYRPWTKSRSTCEGRKRSVCARSRSTSSSACAPSAMRRKRKRALQALTEGAKGGGNLLALSIEAARAKATVGEISFALEKVFGRHRAEIKSISGVYKREAGVDSSAVTKVQRQVELSSRTTAGVRASWSPKSARMVTIAARR